MPPPDDGGASHAAPTPTLEAATPDTRQVTRQRKQQRSLFAAMWSVGTLIMAFGFLPPQSLMGFSGWISFPVQQSVATGLVVWAFYLVSCFLGRSITDRDAIAREVDFRASDVYYLGFLFTLVGLLFAFVQWYLTGGETLASNTPLLLQTINKCGSAISTTVAGIFLRVWALHSLRLHAKTKGGASGGDLGGEMAVHVAEIAGNVRLIARRMEPDREPKPPCPPINDEFWCRMRGTLDVILGPRS